MAFLDFLSGGTNNNAADAAMPYLNQIPGVGQQYYQPFVGQGQKAFQQSGDIFSQQAANPTSFFDAMMQSYSPSSGYQMKQKNALQAAQGAAAAGGRAGNTFDQQNQQEIANGLLDQDRQQYFNNIMGIQNQGLQGLQNQGQVGFAGAQGLSDFLSGAYGSQANAAYSGQAQKNQNQSGLLGSLFGGVGSALGGPLGGYLGKSLFGGGQQQQDPSQSFMSTGLTGQNFPGMMNYGRGGY